MQIGVPRALSFYYLFALYRTFLGELGVRFIETPASTARDLDNLRLCPTDEPCISVKMAFAHGASLLSKGVDALFIPSVVSLEPDNYCCPKMMGLPSMVKAGLELGDSQIISPVIDLKDHPRKWESTWIEAGRKMGIADDSRIRDALCKGLAAWKQAEHDMHRFGISLRRLLDRGQYRNLPGDMVSREGFSTVCAWDEASGAQSRAVDSTAVMGHAYLIHDLFGDTIIKYLSDYGQVILPEMIPRDKSREELSTIFEGEKMWTNEGHILGSCLYLIRNRKVGRIVLVTAFACGPLSIIENYVFSEAERHGIPVLYLCVDEHTGEAGLITRLEAFMDSCRSRGSSRPGETAGCIKHCKLDSPAGLQEGLTQAAQGQDSAAQTGFARSTSGSVQSPVGIVTMGRLDISLSALMREFGVEARIPKTLSEDMVNAGRELAPEFICYPMVVLLGQMRALIEQGASLIIMVQGKGKCRLGWYAQVMETILRRAGYPVRVLAFDSPFPLRSRGREFFSTWKRIVGGPRLNTIIRAVVLALQKQTLVDRSQDVLREVRALEQVRGAGDKRYNEFLMEIDRARNMAEARRAFASYMRDMKTILRVEHEPLKVLLAGEIYVINEPFVNKDVEKTLGSLEQRVRVYRTLDVTNWLNCRIFRTPGAIMEYRKTVDAAAGYLPVDVGGHGQESVGEAVRASMSGMDGVVHLFPFTCMPEIIAQSILVKVSQDLDIPVLSLMVSEQTGAAGLRTRLEAFCDLLEGRRKKLGQSQISKERMAGT